MDYRVKGGLDSLFTTTHTTRKGDVVTTSRIDNEESGAIHIQYTIIYIYDQYTYICTQRALEREPSRVRE